MLEEKCVECLANTGFESACVCCLSNKAGGAFIQFLSRESHSCTTGLGAGAGAGLTRRSLQPPGNVAETNHKNRG